MQVVCSGAGTHTWVGGPASLPSSLSAPPSLSSHITWTLGACGSVTMRPHANPPPPRPFGLIPECSPDALTVPLLMTVIWRQEERGSGVSTTPMFIISESQRIMETWWWMAEGGPGNPPPPPLPLKCLNPS